MSFGGAVSAMNNSIKYNRALAKRRNVYKDSVFEAKWGTSKKIKLKTPTRQQERDNRNKNLAFLASEKKKSQIGLLVGGGIAILIFAKLIHFIF